MAIFYVSSIYPLNPCPEGLYVFLKHFRQGRMHISEENVYKIFSDPEFKDHIGWVMSKLHVGSYYDEFQKQFYHDKDRTKLIHSCSIAAYAALLCDAKLQTPTYPNVSLPVAE